MIPYIGLELTAMLIKMEGRIELWFIANFLLLVALGFNIFNNEGRFLDKLAIISLSVLSFIMTTLSIMYLFSK